MWTVRRVGCWPCSLAFFSAFLGIYASWYSLSFWLWFSDFILEVLGHDQSSIMFSFLLSYSPPHISIMGRLHLFKFPVVLQCSFLLFHCLLLLLTHQLGSYYLHTFNLTPSSAMLMIQWTRLSFLFTIFDMWHFLLMSKRFHLHLT